MVDFKTRRTVRAAHGFTLIEMLVMLGIIAVVSSIAMGVTVSMVRNAKSDSSVAAVLAAVELARDRAIGERRDFQLIFTAPNRIQVIRLEVVGSTQTGTTTVMNTVLDNGMSYRLFTGMPDTPDAFGNASSIAFGITPTIEFTSDGSLLDSSGDPVNGTVFFGDPSSVSTARAVTIFGATGLVTVWKWDGKQWVH